LNVSYFNTITEEKEKPKFPVDIPYSRSDQQFLFRLNIFEKELKASELESKLTFDDIDLVIFTGDLVKKTSYKPYMKISVELLLKS
jgi:hypothetical protein